MINLNLIFSPSVYFKFQNQDESVLEIQKYTGFSISGPLSRRFETGRIRVARMNRLTFGLVCSPYIAIRTMHRIAETVCKGDPEVIAMILNNFYMDDLLSSRPKIEDAISVAKRTSAALDTGDFHLQGWISNSVDFIQNLEPERLVAVDSSSSVPLCMQDTKKLLGIHYKPGPDLLTFRVRGG